MNLIKDESGQENPIILLLIVMSSIITMALLMLVAGTFVDEFMAAIISLRVSIPLSSWGDSMMNELPLKYSAYVFYIPGFFILLVIVWAIKSTIKRHQYTKGNTQYMEEEDGF